MERAVWRLPHAPHHLIRPRTPHTLSCTKLTRSHFRLTARAAEREANAEAPAKEEEKKEEVPFRPSQGNLHLHESPMQSRKKAKVPNAQRTAHFDRVDDDRFMREALHEAQKAASIGEVPVGAVLVSQGRIVARAHNRVEKENDPTAHAEMICIRSTARHSGGWRLLNSTLYVTLEPCPMCAGALLQARVGAVVWGARNPLLGADGSWVSLFPRQPSTDTVEEQPFSYEDNGTAQERSLRHPFNPDIRVRGGVLASDCSEIMKAFFRKRRKKSKEATPNYFSFFNLFSLIRRAFHLVVSIFKFLGLHRFFQSNKLC